MNSAVKHLKSHREDVSIAALRNGGLSDETLSRVIVVEFGGEGSVFDAVDPKGYVVNGKWSLLRDLGEGFSI